ncbi:putative ammonia monooxygenase [Roseivivax marinus]|uniref:Putative ammonia monooxygenase n=2 Tax=Roseivivax marinus TaxID=1379903 RepID=W4HHM7_9RHOB|nr:AbrB family transcriptional regulator [Roseivivax marinus]ETW11490.1 putative ammonia monooxygenase [Roseivivax marinus]UMA66768.1 AbrB family transcriptional regulator [Roseivivax marinus]
MPAYAGMERPVNGAALLRKVATVALGCLGAAAFWRLGLPLPFLFGPLVLCLVAALARVPISSPRRLGKLMRTVLGVAIGASITPEVVDRLPQMAVSLALVPVSVVVTALIGVPFFRRVVGFDAVTAWYASMPGGLQEMVTFGEEAGANVRALTLIHATRLLLIVLIAPFVLTQLFDADLTRPIGDPAASLPPSELAIMAAAAIAGWQIAERIGMFGASILGPMLLAAVLSLAGVIHHRPPAEAILAAQLFIGIALGAGYVGITMAEVRKVVLAGIVFVVIVAAVATAFAETVIFLGLAPPQDGFLAFAPAGQAEMAVIAIVVGADLGYVVTHHLTRVFLVIIGAPIASRLLGVGRRPAEAEPQDVRK